MLKKHKILKDFLLAVLICVLYFVFLEIIFDFVFAINDDRSISNLIGGKFASPSQYGVFVSILISYPLSKLYSRFPDIPFYGIMYFILMFFVLLFLVFFVLNKINKKVSYKSIFITLILSVLLPSIVQPQFTVLSALLAIPLIIIAYNFKNFSIKEKICYGFIFTFFTLFSISIREDVFYMSIPFILLAVFINIEKNKKWIIIPTVFISIILTITGVHIISNNNLLNNQEYSNYIEYNQVRSDLYDFYGFPDYEEHSDLYEQLGISKAAYDMLTNYILDIPEASYENLCALRDFQKANFVNSISLGNIISEIATSFFSTLNCMLLLSIGILFLFVLIKSFKSDIRKFLLILFTILGTIAIAIGLSIFMKFPERIATSLLLFNFALLISLLDGINFNFKILKPKLITLFSIILILLLSFGNISFTKSYNILYVEKCHDGIIIEEYISDDKEHLYMLDINITRPPQTAFLLQPITPVYNNYYFDWFYFTPQYNEMMDRLGYENFDDILQRSNNFKCITLKESNFFNYLVNYTSEKFNRTFVYDSTIDEQYDVYILV